MTEEIERFLGNATEATAKAIAAGLGMPHFDVLKAINKMHGSGLVEREKRAGGGNEYVYWLARGTRPAVTVSNAPAATPEQLVAEANDSMPAEAFSAAMNERVIADLRSKSSAHGRARRRAVRCRNLARERRKARGAHRRADARRSARVRRCS